MWGGGGMEGCMRFNLATDIEEKNAAYSQQLALLYMYCIRPKMVNRVKNGPKQLNPDKIQTPYSAEVYDILNLKRYQYCIIDSKENSSGYFDIAYVWSCIGKGLLSIGVPRQDNWGSSKQIKKYKRVVFF